MTTIPPATSLSDLKTRLRNVSRQVRKAMRLRNQAAEDERRIFDEPVPDYCGANEALLTAGAQSNAIAHLDATEQLLARTLERYFETSEALLSATREAP